MRLARVPLVCASARRQRRRRRRAKLFARLSPYYAALLLDITFYSVHTLPPPATRASERAHALSLSITLPWPCVCVCVAQIKSDRFGMRPENIISAVVLAVAVDGNLAETNHTLLQCARARQDNGERTHASTHAHTHARTEHKGDDL